MTYFPIFKEKLFMGGIISYYRFWKGYDKGIVNYEARHLFQISLFL